MKTTVKKIAEAYAVLGKVKVTTLEDKEVMKVIKMRKAMRQTAEDYNAFLQDAQEKFKPENFDETIRKAEAEWKTMTEQQRKEANQMVAEYNKKVADAVKPEAEKEVEIELEPLSDDSLSKLMKENSLTVAEAEIIAL